MRFVHNNSNMENENNTRDIVSEVFSDLIDLPERQMRRDIDRDELHVLAASIKEKGLINPITVRPTGDRYELVAGQRRLLACRIAGIIRIPCVIRELNDTAALDIMATENLERRDVDIVDEANFIALVMQSTHASVSEMAERLHRSDGYIRDRLTIGQMPDYMQNFLKSGHLKLGTALALAQIEPDDKRRLWVGLAVEKNISVRDAEYWLYQHTLGTLPDIRPMESDVPGAPASEYRPIMATCAIDGKDYVMSETTLITVYKGNVPFVDELAKQVRNEFAASNSPHE